MGGRSEDGSLRRCAEMAGRVRHRSRALSASMSAWPARSPRQRGVLGTASVERSARSCVLDFPAPRTADRLLSPPNPPRLTLLPHPCPLAHLIVPIILPL